MDVLAYSKCSKSDSFKEEYFVEIGADAGSCSTFAGYIAGTFEKYGKPTALYVSEGFEQNARCGCGAKGFSALRQIVQPLGMAHIPVGTDAEHTNELCDILVENDRITAVGEKLDPTGCTVRDMTGKTVMPGFIDSHIHVVCRNIPQEDTIRALARNGVAACTLNNARACGIGDLGLIAPGMSASFLSFDGMLDDDYRKLEQPPFVINRGVVLKDAF